MSNRNHLGQFTSAAGRPRVGGRFVKAVKPSDERLIQLYERVVPVYPSIHDQGLAALYGTPSLAGDDADLRPNPQHRAEFDADDFGTAIDPHDYYEDDQGGQTMGLFYIALGCFVLFGCAAIWAVGKRLGVW